MHIFNTCSIPQFTKYKITIFTKCATVCRHHINILDTLFAIHAIANHTSTVTDHFQILANQDGCSIYHQMYRLATSLHCSLTSHVTACLSLNLRSGIMRNLWNWPKSYLLTMYVFLYKNKILVEIFGVICIFLSYIKYICGENAFASTALLAIINFRTCKYNYFH